jgi:hypothetical protein
MGASAEAAAPQRGVTMASLLLCCCAGGAAAAAVALPAGVLNATAHGGNGGGCEGVVADGTTDVTTALQRCISRAYASNAALFLSPGRYLVSDTLWLNQSSGGAGPVNIVNERFRPNTLFGSTAALPARPTIVLAAHSRGFGNASSPKNVLKVTNPGSEDVNMNQAVRGIDIEVQGGNAGAIALFFHGAQGGLVQDVTVRLANDAFAGFVSSAAPPHRQACPCTPPSVTQKAVITAWGCGLRSVLLRTRMQGGGGGAGTSHVNVEVIGGVHGLYFLESEPTPVLANARLRGQSGSAVVASHQQTLVVAGLHIVRRECSNRPFWSKRRWAGGSVLHQMRGGYCARMVTACY